MRYLMIVCLALLSACSTVNTKTLSYCDTDENKFIGITFYTEAKCKGYSNSESGTEISIPGE